MNDQYAMQVLTDVLGSAIGISPLKAGEVLSLPWHFRAFCHANELSQVLHQLVKYDVLVNDIQKSRQVKCLQVFRLGGNGWVLVATVVLQSSMIPTKTGSDQDVTDVGILFEEGIGLWSLLHSASLDLKPDGQTSISQLKLLLLPFVVLHTLHKASDTVFEAYQLTLTEAQKEVLGRYQEEENKAALHRCSFCGATYLDTSTTEANCHSCMAPRSVQSLVLAQTRALRSL